MNKKILYSTAKKTSETKFFWMIELCRELKFRKLGAQTKLSNRGFQKRFGIFLGLICFFGFFLSNTFASDWNLPGVNLITRQQRGADESLRFASSSKKQRDAQLKAQKEAELQALYESDLNGFFDQKRSEYQASMATDYLVSNYPSEQTVDQINDEYNGNYLKWPESIHKNKTKIIIHHTAGDYSSILTGGKQTAITALKDIYKYHTINKGRGDIGYNFIIDPFGNIYEGRAGGEGVVAAHDAWNNTPSLGISLMGNFNIQKPTDAQIKSLISLTTALAKKYKIDPNAKKTYFKASKEAPYLSAENNYAIVGHKDAGITSCPGTNLYNKLQYIRDQVTKNLSNYSYISYNTKPVTSKSDIGITISGFYYTNVEKNQIFYLDVSKINLIKVTSCKSDDSTILIKSCSLEKGKLKINIEKKGQASGMKTIIISTSKGDKKISFSLLRQNDLDTIINSIKKNYMSKKGINFVTGNVSKITHKITLQEAQQYLKNKIKVLLYELSINFDTREMSCEGGCNISYDGKNIFEKNKFNIESHDGFLYLTLGEDIISPDVLIISSAKGGLVKFENYDRKSYSKIPRNTFHGSIIFKKDQIKNLQTSKFQNQFVVINELNFDDYMKGIAETNDIESPVKQKITLLLAKTYALFYMNTKNKHPSISDGSYYTAIDNPDMFQKYVGAGLEKTLKKVPLVLNEIKNQILLYSGYVPILPYFSCSAGFTLSAKDKRGRNDTPYLQSRMDFEKCPDFQGHGVGLSGRGSQFLAEKGRDYKMILEYYYPGIEIK